MVRGGCLIRIAREARGYTQEEIAYEWGVDKDTVGRWERLKIEPKFFDVVGIITQVCNLTLAEVEEMAFENN